ncbi:DUF1569 domain-containing protein [Marinicella sediminis]|uniref:DUF1569 domain-containing protein n=1 Tax=Marinicella sediminis TaxID=1792834 RepID=A0ABV7JIW1_9GAMM|nr:DUF1569 domain-containing protein [Marinicella sediminis]
MNRRQLLKRTVLIGGVAATVTGGWWFTQGGDPDRLTIEDARLSLDELMASGRQPNGQWNLSQVLNHLAQSIEFSMSGYPQHQSAWFKNTVGQLAFRVFSIRASMSHNLTEAIPGAPALATGDVVSAHQRLDAALQQFAVFEGVLQPHFAYGHLSHDDYLKAHVMHIYNHLEAMQPVG